MYIKLDDILDIIRFDLKNRKIWGSRLTNRRHKFFNPFFIPKRHAFSRRVSLSTPLFFFLIEQAIRKE